MKKTIREIADAISEIMDEYGFAEDTALRVLEAAAGGIDYVADYVSDECDCGCDCEKQNDEDEEEEDRVEVLDSNEVTVGSRDRVTIPAHIIYTAEEVLGSINSKQYGGKFTVIRYPDRIEVNFGEVDVCADDDEVEKVTVNHLTPQGAMTFSAAPTFLDGDEVDVLVNEDGVITVE